MNELDNDELKPPAKAGPKQQPKKRVADPKGAHSLANKILNDTNRQARLSGWDLCAGQYAGEDPDDQAELEAEGKGHLSNFNSGMFKRLIDTDVAPFYSLITTSRRPAVFQTIDGANFERQAFMDKWAARYRKMTFAWPSYRQRLGQYLWQRAMYGHGPIIWDKELSWQFKTVPTHRLLVPQGSPADPDDWTLFYIVDYVKPHELIDILQKLSKEDAKAYKIDKWNKDNVGKAIKKFADENNLNQETLDAIGSVSVEQQEINESMLNDSMWNSFTKWDRIMLIRCYVREFDGKWSELVMMNDGDVGFLYENIGVYEKPSDFFLANPYESAFNFEDIRGIGEHVSSLAIARDRSLNKFIDLSILNSMLVIQGMSEGDEQYLEQIEWDQDATYIPANLKIESQNVRGDNGMLNVYQVLTEVEEINTRHRSAGSPRNETQSRTNKEYLGRLGREG